MKETFNILMKLMNIFSKKLILQWIVKIVDEKWSVNNFFVIKFHFLMFLFFLEVLNLIWKLLLLIIQILYMFQVNFVVYANAEPEDRFFIVGGIPALGTWSTDKGLLLSKYEIN